MPATWGSTEQRDFLRLRVDEYILAQKAGDYGPFWDQLFKDWEAKYPESDALFPGRVATDLTLDENTSVTKAILARQAVRKLIKSSNH